MTIKAGKSAPDTCVLGALRAFGLVVPLLFDRLSASTTSLHVALGRVARTPGFA
jgi:hypothetical protein